MEAINSNEIDVRPIGSAIGISYILFGISFIFSLSSVFADVGILVGIIGVIIFLTQRKYIKPEIKTYVYISIILYIVTTIVFGLFLVVSIAAGASSMVTHVRNNELAGIYMVPIIAEVVYASMAISIVSLITYILTSYKFIETKKYIFIVLLFIATILENLYSFLFLKNFSSVIGAETIRFSDISSVELKIESLGFVYPYIIIRIISVLIFISLFVYLGVKIMRKPEPYLSL